MDIGIFGTGRMGVRLAAIFARASRRVLLGSRDPGNAGQMADAIGVKAVTYEEAAEADLVLPALFIRHGSFDVLDRLAAKLSGKVLIDISNPYNEDHSDFTTPWDTSAAEEIQRRLPHTLVVAAFKNISWALLEDPPRGEKCIDVLIAGDSPEAKAAFLHLCEGTPFRYLDAGPLMQARTIERLTLLTGPVGRQIGAYPRMSWKLVG